MKRNKRIFLASLFTGVLMVGFQNCSQPSSIMTSSDSVADPTNTSADTGTNIGAPDPVNPTPTLPIDASSYQIKPIASSKYICEPFGSSTALQAKSGLKAELAYIDPIFPLSATTKNSFSVLNYFEDQNPFAKSDAAIYLSQINVPTRKFTEGFKLSDGTYLSDLQGNKLNEYFGLKMKSLLKLSDSDLDGQYEIATISDDESILYTGAEGAQTQLINNGGVHSARIKCATQRVTLDHTSRLPITYYYNQGPRAEIANVMVWKYVGKDLAEKITNPNPLCSLGSALFWDASNSAEASSFLQLKADGYKIVGTGNFELPDSQVNPCASQTQNQITASQFLNVTKTSASLKLAFMAQSYLSAQLFIVTGTTNTLVEKYDSSTVLTDKIQLDFMNLILGAEYRLELTIDNPVAMTRVVNEVRFQLLQNN